MHDSRVHEWEMGSEVAGWAGAKGVQGGSMVTGLVNEGNGLRIKHKMHANKLIFIKAFFSLSTLALLFPPTLYHLPYERWRLAGVGINA